MSAENERDVLIIGGGPAGLSASLWCADLGLSATLFDACEELGGQLLKIHNPVTNYLGLAASNGREIRESFLRSFGPERNEHVVFCEVASVSTSDLAIDLADGRRFGGRALIIASGVRRRELGVPGEREFAGKGIIASGSRERTAAAGERVAVVGGGDAALENALILAEYAASVVLIHRRAEFAARDEFVRRAESHPKIHFRSGSAVSAFRGGERLEQIDLTHSNGQGPEFISVDLAVVRVGVEPNSDLVRGKVAVDESGYIVVDRECRTSLPGVYAIGDVSNPAAPTIAGAAGEGATAAKAIFSCLSSRTRL
jgi:thioredoxin reductase (NADPH)